MSPGWGTLKMRCGLHQVSEGGAHPGLPRGRAPAAGGATGWEGAVHRGAPPGAAAGTIAGPAATGKRHQWLAAGNGTVTLEELAVADTAGDRVERPHQWHYTVDGLTVPCGYQKQAGHQRITWGKEVAGGEAQACHVRRVKKRRPRRPVKASSPCTHAAAIRPRPLIWRARCWLQPTSSLHAAG